METNEAVVKQLTTHYGKPFEIVSGRNAYTFEKFRHMEMLAKDGIYLLLENAPRDDLKIRYDKALIIPARVVDKFFPTNDPEKVKTSFHLGADKMRFEFRQQQYKLYQNTPCIFKTIKFEDTRREITINRVEQTILEKNGGEYIFLYTVGGTDHHPSERLVQIEKIPAKEIKFAAPTQKTTRYHISLSAYTLKMLDGLGWRGLLTKEQIPASVQATPESTKAEEIIDTYLNKGTPIKIILPEGKHELVLECTITKCERRVV